MDKRFLSVCALKSNPVQCPYLTEAHRSASKIWELHTLRFLKTCKYTYHLSALRDATAERHVLQ